MSDKNGKLAPKGVFLAGLLAGATEAVLVVSPMEVVKIRLQAQQHSLADPLDIPKYRYAPKRLQFCRVKTNSHISETPHTPHLPSSEKKESARSTEESLLQPCVKPRIKVSYSDNQAPGNLTNSVCLGVNFTAYQEFKRLAKEYQPQYAVTELPSWQTMLLGLISGAMGPFSNAPIDTIKT